MRSSSCDLWRLLTLQEILGTFQSDRSADVRKFVLGFAEEACRKDPNLIPKSALTFSYLLSDDAPAVVKRAIMAVINLYGASPYEARPSH